MNEFTSSVSSRRFSCNPLFTPQGMPPSQPGLQVLGVFNPGAFTYEGKVGLVLRIAEKPLCGDGETGTMFMDEDGHLVPWIIAKDDPRLVQKHPVSLTYDGVLYLTSLSHLMVVWSTDGGETFSLDNALRLFPSTPSEAFGLEDCRVTELEGTWYLTYTAVSRTGWAVAMRSTRDWKTFTKPRLILPPPNKDAALFPRKIDGRYYLLHRPTTSLGGEIMWIADSTDLEHWGNHQPLAAQRPGCWDDNKLGAGAQPIETPEGWLEIYHGVKDRTYRLGAMLLDLEDPTQVIARTKQPIFQPETDYERDGFIHNCVFSNGYVQQGDRLRLYYGAADSKLGGVDFSIQEILSQCRPQ